MAIAIGALLDGIPESMVIGLSLIGEVRSDSLPLSLFSFPMFRRVSQVRPDMKKAGRSRAHIFGLWGGIVLISAIAALIGYVGFRGGSGDFIAAITAVAAGAMLAMLADTMIPEAFDEARNWAGLITVLCRIKRPNESSSGMMIRSRSLPCDIVHRP